VSSWTAGRAWTRPATAWSTAAARSPLAADAGSPSASSAKVRTLVITAREDAEIARQVRATLDMA
jgi:hypothetical protein